MGFCKDMPNAIECFKDVEKQCANRTSKVSKLIKIYSPVKTQYCGKGDNTVCFQKMPSCIAPYTAASCHNITRNNVDNFHRCCGQSRDMMACLKNAGCPDDVFPYGQKAIFEAKYNMYCNQYQEYCPDLQACFKPFNGIGNLVDICPKIPSVLSCVTKSCKDKPQNGKLSMKQIDSLYREVCQGLDDHQGVTNCTGFNSCTMASVPSIPGSQPNLQLAIHGGDPLYWCKMAKGASNCLALEVSNNAECNVTDDVKTDITILKEKTDIMCKHVRDPCPGVGVCVDELFNLGDTRSLLTVCHNMSNFTTCMTTALTTCGDSSLVHASYSLSNMEKLFTQACDEFAKITGPVTCNNINNIEVCFDVDLPTNQPNLNDKLSDPTFWCKTLKRILKCGSSMSSSCDHTKEISTNLLNLYNKVERYCPSQVAEAVKAEKRPENSVSSVVSSALLILALPTIVFL
ncbi:uncharacterized protein LOC126825207 [Patella vulgata]|uniref:uncharacterized protein LOC126825207 n=1 Tax=Patella vulgata TaxID=6465 RepID=UPI00217F778D|nr:uncharacterized protein LOC126825207 [Patella vulgata]